MPPFALPFVCGAGGRVELKKNQPGFVGRTDWKCTFLGGRVHFQPIILAP